MTSPAARRRVAVIGGGIAGLTAAYRLLESLPNAEVTVYEAAASVGGKLRLGEVAGLTVDLGAESMLNRRPEATALAEAVGLGAQLVYPATSGAGVWTGGRVRALPPSLMGIPSDLRAARRSGVLRRRAVLRAAAERGLPELDVSTDVGVGVLVARRLGRQVRDRLVEPLLGGVYAGHSDELSLHATLPLVVSAVNEHGGLLRAAARATAPPVAGTAAVPVFAGIEGGVGRLAQETDRQVIARGGTVRLDTTIRELARTETGWQLVSGTPARPVRHDVDAVVVAVPATPSSRLLRDAAPVAARELGHIEYASVGIVTLAMAASAVDVGLAGTGFLVPPVDGHVIKAATFASQKWAWLGGDTVVIRCSVGRHREERDLQYDDSELVEAAMMDLREAVGLRAPLLDATVTRWGGALPQYAVGHLLGVERIQDAIAQVPRLEVCGAAYGGVGIPAVVASAEAAVARLVSDLEGGGTMAS